MRRRNMPAPLVMYERDSFTHALVRHWALRLMVGLRLEAHFADNAQDIPGIASILGLDLLKDPLWNDAQSVSHEERDALLRKRAQRIRQMERASEPPVDAKAGTFHNNLDSLADYIGLSLIERRLLELAMALNGDPAFSEIEAILSHHTQEAYFRVFAYLLNVPVADVDAALQPKALLQTTGLVTTDGIGHFTDNLQTTMRVMRRLPVLLQQEGFNPVDLLSKFADWAPSPQLTLDDFPHMGETSTLLSTLVNRAWDTKRRGLNVLLYGFPGTGKSEYVRALCRHLDCSVREVNTADEEGNPIEGDGRARAFLLAQKLFQRSERSLLVFEELEDILSGDDSTPVHFGQSRRARVGKGWFNRLLETNAVPTIWLSNSIRQLDHAYLRRFSFVVEFPPPSRRIRRAILKRYFQALPVRRDWIDRLSNNDYLTPALIEQGARTASDLGITDAEKVEREVERVLEGTLRAMGERRPICSKTDSSSGYDVDYLNTDTDVVGLLSGLKKLAAARICLYGPPGTGKTAYARHLADELDRPLIVKRASDILSSWWGATEQNIARMFEEAITDGAVLLMDEVDSLLKDRARLNLSWEASEVNELLTQMETFEGLFIATTNLVQNIDPASLRRFDFKIAFGYMRPDQRLAMFTQTLQRSHCRAIELTEAIEHGLGRLDNLTPGDFAVAARQVRVTGQILDTQTLLQSLQKECQQKDSGQSTFLGFTG